MWFEHVPKQTIKAHRQCTVCSLKAKPAQKTTLFRCYLSASSWSTALNYFLPIGTKLSSRGESIARLWAVFRNNFNDHGLFMRTGPEVWIIGITDQYKLITTPTDYFDRSSLKRNITSTVRSACRSSCCCNFEGVLRHWLNTGLSTCRHCYERNDGN